MIHVNLPLLPVYLVDFFGSTVMIVFALVSFYYARRLLRLEPKNFLWTYLFWLCLALVTLALSRSIGHLFRYIFILSGAPHLWDFFAPYTGGLNSLSFCAVAVLTLSYYNTRAVIDRMREDAENLRQANLRLAEAHTALHQLNLTLEERVEKRTRELRLSEEKFRSLFEASKDMIFFCDAQGRICDINDSGLDLLGAGSREEVVGRPLAEFFVNREKYQHYQQTLTQQGHVKDFEVEFKDKDGSRRYLMVTASAIRNEAGVFQGCEGIAKDLTHFKEVTDQLIQSEKMTSVGQLAAGVAHEINTPLGIILGYTQLLEEDFEDKPEVLEILQTIEKHTKICRRIVADLLKFSHPSAGQQRTTADINRCLEEVLSIVEHTLNMDHIYIHRCLAESLPLAAFDPERIRQVFVNLLTNAHHAIGKEGIVGVWTRYHPESEEIEVIIGDSGGGIPPEVINRIFDPFFTTKGVGKGTGLGLSVSFGIIKDHNGRIEVESPPRDPELLAVDTHTAFHIFLPIRKEEKTAGKGE